MDQLKINIPREELKVFCLHWKVRTFYLFGSVLTEEFDYTHSDIDVMLDFYPEERWTLFDLVNMREELSIIFNRSVDVVTKTAIENGKNEYRKKSILDTARAIYEQAA